MRILIGITENREVVKIESDYLPNDSEWRKLMPCVFLASVGTSPDETSWSVGRIETWLYNDKRHYAYAPERSNDACEKVGVVTETDRLLKDIAMHGVK